jgi:hypothetical protein
MEAWHVNNVKNNVAALYEPSKDQNDGQAGLFD